MTTTPVRKVLVSCAKLLMAGFVSLTGVNGASGKDMTNFKNVRELSERIIGEYAYGPQKLADILAVEFRKTGEQMPNHFQYSAEMGEGHVFGRCSLRSPKTTATKQAILVCDLDGDGVSTSDIRDAYGSRIVPVPASPSSPASALHYLRIPFENATLSYGYDQESNIVRSVVFKFKLL